MRIMLGFTLSSLVFILIPLSSTSGERSLQLAHVLYRHGHRSPLQAFPTDNNTESTWPLGFSQLTKNGMKQQYELGQWLRQRYMSELKLLGERYDPRQVRVQSTEYERTIMSAMCNLQGMFPTDLQEGDPFYGTPPWQPVPVFTTPWMPKYPPGEFLLECDSSKRVSDAITDHFMEENKDFFDKVKAKAGLTGALSLDNYTLLADTLIREKNEGRPLPVWVDDATFLKLKASLDFNFEVHFGNMSVDTKKLNSELLDIMVGNMKAHMNGSNTDSKLFMYSGHDTYVAVFLGLFDVFNNVVPPTASCIMVELYKDQDGLYTVQMLYRNDTERPPYVLKFPECAEQCPVHNFFHVASGFIPENGDQSCQEKSPSLPFGVEWNLGWVIAAVSLAIVCILPLMVCIALVAGSKGRGRLRAAKQRMEPINFHLLGGPNSDTEDESVFDS